MTQQNTCNLIHSSAQWYMGRMVKKAGFFKCLNTSSTTYLFRKAWITVSGAQSSRLVKISERPRVWQYAALASSSRAMVTCSCPKEPLICTLMIFRNGLLPIRASSFFRTAASARHFLMFRRSWRKIPMAPNLAWSFLSKSRTLFFFFRGS